MMVGVKISVIRQSVAKIVADPRTQFVDEEVLNRENLVVPKYSFKNIAVISEKVSETNRLLNASL